MKLKQSTISRFSKVTSSQRRAQVRRIKKRLKQAGFLLVNGVILFSVLSLMIAGRQTPKKSQASISEKQADEVVALDQISSADIAASIADAARLPEAIQVRNQADSRNALVAIAVSDDVVVTKPQIVSEATTSTQSRADITEHVVAAGETVDSIAAAFGVSSDSIRWSNGISGNAINEGRTVVIPPKNRNGIVYKVTANDTLEGLAQRYSSTVDKIISFNDLEITRILPTDQYIFIPDGSKPPEPVRTVSSFYTVSTINFTPRFGGNGYSFGYCTYWAAGRRAEVGNPIPSNWGNANTWDDYARASGFAVDNIPSAGAVFQTDGYGHSIYHVAYVESVNADGSITISEMNYRGWNVPSTRIIPAGEVPKYNYIH